MVRHVSTNMQHVSMLGAGFGAAVDKLEALMRMRLEAF